MCVQCLSPAVSRSSDKDKHKRPFRMAAAAHMTVASWRFFAVYLDRIRVENSSVVREPATAKHPWAAFQQIALSNWLVAGHTPAKLHRSKAIGAEQP
jgi:hypothetical protein